MFNSSCWSLQYSQCTVHSTQFWCKDFTAKYKTRLCVVVASVRCRLTVHWVTWRNNDNKTTVVQVQKSTLLHNLPTTLFPNSLSQLRMSSQQKNICQNSPVLAAGFWCTLSLYQCWMFRSHYPAGQKCSLLRQPHSPDPVRLAPPLCRSCCCCSGFSEIIKI